MAYIRKLTGEEGGLGESDNVIGHRKACSNVEYEHGATRFRTARSQFIWTLIHKYAHLAAPMTTHVVLATDVMQHAFTGICRPRHPAVVGRMYRTRRGMRCIPHHTCSLQPCTPLFQHFWHANLK